MLSAHRFFAVPTEETLEALLTESAVKQEVTEQLGYQVRQAVEVLVESIDKADQDSGRQLTEGINEKVLYEAALAVMMRLVFLLCADEGRILGKLPQGERSCGPGVQTFVREDKQVRVDFDSPAALL